MGRFRLPCRVGGREVTVLREGREVSLTMPEDMNMLEMLKSNPPFMVPFIPSVIDSVLPSSPVYEARNP